MLRKKYQFTHAFEIFDAIELAENKEERIEIIRAYNDNAFISVLRFCFDRSLEMAIPSGEDKWSPKYIPSYEQFDPEYWNLISRVSDFKYFIKGIVSSVSDDTRKRLFITLLQSCYIKDSHIMVWAKDRVIEEKYKNINGELINEAIPGLIRKVYNKEREQRELQEQRLYNLSNTDKHDRYEFDICTIYNTTDMAPSPSKIIPTTQ